MATLKPAGAPNLLVETHVHGNIAPERPGMSNDDVVKVVVRDLDNRGAIIQAFEKRTVLKGGG